jgi:hypothetical protein
MTRIYPLFSDAGFQHDDDPLPSKELYLGHPTMPGFRDPFTPRRPIVDLSTIADGSPGIPRVFPGPGSQGPGSPGMHGAMSKKTRYAGNAEGEG